MEKERRLTREQVSLYENRERVSEPKPVIIGVENSYLYRPAKKQSSIRFSYLSMVQLIYFAGPIGFSEKLRTKSARISG